MAGHNSVLINELFGSRRTKDSTCINSLLRPVGGNPRLVDPEVSFSGFRMKLLLIILSHIIIISPVCFSTSLEPADSSCGLSHHLFSLIRTLNLTVMGIEQAICTRPLSQLETTSPNWIIGPLLLTGKHILGVVWYCTSTAAIP